MARRSEESESRCSSSDASRSAVVTMADSAVAENVGGAQRRGVRIDRHVGGAGLQSAEHRHYAQVALRRKQADAMSASDAGAAQHRRDAVAPFVELSIGQRLATPFDGRAVGMAQGAVSQAMPEKKTHLRSSRLFRLVPSKNRILAGQHNGLTWGSAPHPGSVACGAPTPRAAPSRARRARRRYAQREQNSQEPHNGLRRQAEMTRDDETLDLGRP